MSPTVTGTTMPILTNALAARLAKKLLPHSSLVQLLSYFWTSEFAIKNLLINAETNSS